MNEGGYLKGTYVEKGRPKNIRVNKDENVKVTPKSRSGNLSFRVPVNNRYIESIGGGIGGGRHKTKVDVNVNNDPVFQETIRHIHKNASIQLGLNPKTMPLNLKSIGAAYNDYKNIVKNTEGIENRQSGTGVGLNASFQLNSNGELSFSFNKDTDRTKRGRIGFRLPFKDGGKVKC